MHQDEHLITPDLLEEADAGFHSSFKPEVTYEKTLSLALSQQPVSRFQSSYSYGSSGRITKRTINSLLAEAYLCKQFGWEILVEDSPGAYKFPELVAVLKSVHDLSEKKVALQTPALSLPEMDSLRTHVQSVVADLKTINKGTQKRISPHFSLTPFISMFSDAKGFQRRVLITLGIGEHLEGLPELHRFIETHTVTEVTFTPLTTENHPLAAARPPSSFYCARWIAETRIAFPKLKILAATSPERFAELGLFLKAGINTITGFPALEIFHSESAQVIEEECKNAGRTLVGTLTDLSLLDRMRQEHLQDDVKEKLDKYIGAIKRTK